MKASRIGLRPTERAVYSASRRWSWLHKWPELIKRLPPGAKQAAEKVVIDGENHEKHPSAAKARVDFAGSMARVNSCPFKASSFCIEFFRSL